MKERANDSEDKRAYRISFRLNACHKSLADIYEGLVDRDFSSADRQVRQVIAEMKLILKSIKHDDF